MQSTLFGAVAFANPCDDFSKIYKTLLNEVGYDAPPHLRDAVEEVTLKFFERMIAELPEQEAREAAEVLRQVRKEDLSKQLGKAYVQPKDGSEPIQLVVSSALKDKERFAFEFLVHEVRHVVDLLKKHEQAARVASRTRYLEARAFRMQDEYQLELFDRIGAAEFSAWLAKKHSLPDRLQAPFKATLELLEAMRKIQRSNLPDLEKERLVKELRKTFEKNVTKQESAALREFMKQQVTLELEALVDVLTGTATNRSLGLRQSVRRSLVGYADRINSELNPEKHTEEMLHRILEYYAQRKKDRRRDMILLGVGAPLGVATTVYSLFTLIDSSREQKK